MPRGRKRSGQDGTAAAAAAAAAGTPRESQRAKKQKNADLDEDKLGAGAGAATEKEVEQQRLDNIFWERFDTPLLSAWLSDYPDHNLEPSKMHDRNALIAYLVQNGAERPKGKTSSDQLQHLRGVFAVHNPKFNGPLPGMHVTHQQPAAAAAADHPARSNELGDDDIDMTIDNDAGAAATPAKKARATAQLYFGSAHSVTTAQHQHGAGKSMASAHSAPVAPAVTYRSCATCLTPAINQSCSQWLCTGCGLRGDLLAGDPANIALNAQRVAIAQSVRGPSSYAASTMGQSHAAAEPARETGLSALDREYAKLAKQGEPCLLFVGPKAGAPLAHTAALRIVRTTPNGPATQMPSEHLIDLIRVGKLKAVGHAIPRPLDNNSIEDGMPELLSVGADGTLKTQAKTFVPPSSCTSAQQFCLALFSTILPSLIDRPNGLVQWMALGRTALELEKLYDWPTASAYVAQLLNERTTVGEPFNVISTECLHSVQMARQHNVSRGVPEQSRIQQQQQQHSAAAAAGGSICVNWNNQRCVGPCKYQHACLTCQSPNHPRALCPRGLGGPPKPRKPKDGKGSERAEKPPASSYSKDDSSSSVKKE